MNQPSQEALTAAKQIAGAYPQTVFDVEAVGNLIDANFARLRDAFGFAARISKEHDRVGRELDSLCCDLNPDKGKDA